jgi:hypothetical protein
MHDRVQANEEPAGRVALAVGPFMALAAAGLLEPNWSVTRSASRTSPWFFPQWS